MRKMGILLSEKEINEIAILMAVIFYAGLFCGIFYIGIYNANSVVLFVRDYLVVGLSILVAVYLAKPVFEKIFFKNVKYRNQINQRSKV